MTSRGLLTLAAAVLFAACTGSAAPTSRAQRIASERQLIGGPKAVGRIGDYLLENDKIRVVIHDKGQGRISTPYGGTIIDADLVRPSTGSSAGNDQLAEVVPAWLFEVVNPTTVRVTADGSDGGPAEITVTGVGAELLQMVALLDTGLLFPPSLEFSQSYRLSPGKSYVEIESTITNTTSGNHTLPYLNPSELAALGLNIPGIEDLELSTPFGHLLLFGAEQQMFAPGVTGFNIRFGLDDAYGLASGFPAFPGLVADYVASRGAGVSYGFAVPSGPQNYVNAFAQLYQQNQNVTPESLLLLFNYSSVAGVYSAQPPPVLAAGQSFSFTSYFIVGRGDAASIYDVVQELHGTPTGQFAGRVLDARSGAATADTTVMVLAPVGDGIVTQITPNERGDFAAKLPPGNYRYQLVSDERGSLAPVAFTVAENRATSVRLEVPPPATLSVFVVDERGRPTPAKVTLVGDYDLANRGEPARDFLYSLPLGERTRPTSFDPSRTDFIETLAYTNNGYATIEAKVGSYEMVVSRGPEYELFRVPVELVAGQVLAQQVQLTRAFSTDGWVAMDSHLHAQPSADSKLTLGDRLRTVAGEGVEIAVATDHNFITDYSPAIASSGLLDWVYGLPGVELTTFEMGHFNAYPLQVDPGSTRGGEFKWISETPTSLFTQLRALGGGRENTIIQVNHPETAILGYFSQFNLDPESGNTYIPSGISAVFSPFGPEFAPAEFSLDFDALEIINGKTLPDIHNFRAPNPLPPGPFPDPQPVAGEIVRDADGRVSYPGAVDTWFTLLDRDLRPTGLGSSDSHGVALDGEAGFSRTMVYLGPDSDQVGTFDRFEVVDAIKSHRAIATNAPFVELFVGDAMIGDEVVAGPSVDIRVRVHAPAWAPVDRVIIWTNGGVKLIDEAIPSGSGTDFEKTYAVTLPVDSWVVAEVTGSTNMFPAVTALEFESVNTDAVISALGVGFDLSGLTGGLGPAKSFYLTPFAITNPIWVDVDGGGWTSPRPSLAR